MNFMYECALFNLWSIKNITETFFVTLARDPGFLCLREHSVLQKAWISGYQNIVTVVMIDRATNRERDPELIQTGSD